jgi:broad specificity phosphatase PhoE
MNYNNRQHTWLYLVRHGQTTWNAMHRWQGQSITPLNETGRRQATLVSERLADEGLTAIYTSDLMRTRQTAEMIAARAGAPLFMERRLRELDMGLWQGHTPEEIAALDPEHFDAYHTDILNGCPPDGESRAHVVWRAEAALYDITAAHPGERVAVVSHEDTLRAILYRVDGYELNTLLTARIDNCAVTLLRGTPGAWEVVWENDNAHLRALHAVA